jgi:hypothetical protein
MSSRYFLRVLLVVISASSAAAAQSAVPSSEQETGGARTLRLQPASDEVAPAAQPERAAVGAQDAVPRVGGIESAFSMRAGTAMLALEGQGTFASRQPAQGEGGMHIAASPIGRLTLQGFVGRGRDGRWAPTAGAHVRILGEQARGFALGAMARYRTEGFTEAGGEAEAGLTLGFKRSGLVLDANALAGVGVEEKEAGESDAEFAGRAGYDVASWVRLGVQGQGRRRLTGDRVLINGKTWDASVGPVLMLGVGDNMMLAASGGVTNRDVAQAAPFVSVFVAGVMQLPHERRLGTLLRRRRT